METERSEMKKRHYNNGDGEFILEPLSASLVKVTHREQTGYFGISKNWDVAQPYSYTTRNGERMMTESMAHSVTARRETHWTLCVARC